MASIQAYLLTRDASGLQVHMPFSGTVSTSVPGGAVELTLQTGHPWSGDTDIEVTHCSSTERWDLSLRFPDWASKEGTRIALNGEHVETSWDGSYITVSRHWRPGDHLQVSSSIPVLVLRPHWRVDAVRDCVAVQRGPLVQCIEADDLGEGVAIEDVVLDGTRPLEATYEVPAGLEGYVKVAVNAWGGQLDGPDLPLYAAEDGGSLNTKPSRLTFVPYFARGNRLSTAMRVWVSTPSAAAPSGRGPVKTGPTSPSSRQRRASTPDGELKTARPGMAPSAPIEQTDSL